MKQPTSNVEVLVDEALALIPKVWRAEFKAPFQEMLHRHVKFPKVLTSQELSYIEDCAACIADGEAPKDDEETLEVLGELLRIIRKLSGDG